MDALFNLGDTLSFDEMARRVVALPSYRAGPVTLEAVQHRMTEQHALMFIAHRLLGDPLLCAAARKVYDANWVIRQATVTLLGAMEASASVGTL